jgi:acyl-lipid omega-6 desaturase (Delta-12 desaturase)
MATNAPAGTGNDRFQEETAGWKDIVRKYQQPSKLKGAWQLVNTLGPYVGLWVAMYFAMSVSWWLVIPLALLAGGFLVRTFIIFHDCTHGSFFKSKRANEITGIITGFLVFTPFHIWRWEHTIHHASAGDLDRRGIGDVWTLTVKEYLESSRWRRFAYRLSRNPIVLFLIAPLALFLVIQRFPVPKAGKREQRWLLYTNIALLLFVTGLALTFGLVPYLIIQLTVLGFATTSGVWLFYVQHQFEDAYWERRPDWDYAKAALEGSSFYKLPKILQWFSGNIGFHHIHHLSPRIPNYHLERAHNSEPMFRNIKPLTVRTSIKSLNFRLWDEERQKLIGYKGLKALPRRRN